MGRKPLNSSKAEAGRSPASHGGNLSLIGEEFGAKTTELLPELQEKLPGNGDAAPGGIKLPCESVNPSKVVIRSQPKRKYKSAVDGSEIRVKMPKAPARRSGRLLTAVMPTTNKDVVSKVEDLTACDGEEQRAAASSHEETRLPDLSLDEKNLEEKVTSLSNVVEQLKTRFEEHNSKFEKMEKFWIGSSTEAATSTDDLHEECQKKYEALINENRGLVEKLSNAYMMHSKGNCLFGELLEKVKDIMLLFGLKAADMAALAPDATNSIP